MKKAVIRKRPSTKIFDKNIKSIIPFINSIDIYKEYCTSSEFDALSEDFKEWLTLVDNCAPCPVRFFVINGGTVLLADDMNGDFLGVQTLTQFFSENLKAYNETREAI